MTSLFKLHNPIVNSYMQKSADNNADGVLMASLSMRRPWITVGTQMKEYKSHGLRAKAIWGNKRATAKWVRRNKNKLFENVTASLNFTGRRRKVQMMLAFLDVPGIGLAKAGFCCQLFAGIVGCIDTHNIRLYNVDPNLLDYDKKATLETRLKKINAYLDLCQTLRSERMWNKWCRFLFKNDPRFDSPEQVSRLHAEFLGIKVQGR